MDRLESFDVTVPAGTALATPAETALLFDLGEVTAIEIVVPSGPSGLVGWQIMHSNEVVIPRDRTKWIVTDGEKIVWELRGYPVGRAWRVRAYNTDVYDHTLYFRFLVDEVVRSAPSRVDLVPILQTLPQVVTE